jgi:hypothetical protein
MLYDCSINGLSVGPLQDITIEKMDGLTGSPPVRTALVDRLGAHGAFYGRDLYGPRTVTLTLNIKPNPLTGSTLDSLCQQLETALIAQQTGSLQLILNGGKRLLNCRPTAWDLPRTPAMGNERWGKATVQLIAADPFVYDAQQTIQTLPIFVTTGGWTFPWNFPWVFGSSAVPQDASAFNSGSIEVGPLFRITGPFDVGFQLRNLTTGGLLQVGMVMAASDWVDVDMQNETIMFQSFSNRRNALIQGTDFWRLIPGANTIQMSSLGAISSANAQMYYRSAYTTLRG